MKIAVACKARPAEREKRGQIHSRLACHELYVIQCTYVARKDTSFSGSHSKLYSELGINILGAYI